MPKDETYKLEPDFRRTEQGDHYQLGFDVNGVWVPVALLNAPDFDQRVQEAAQAAEAEKSSKK
jgi:hypothetical protein